MAYIRATTKLPSGIDGWYIYYNGEREKLFICSPSYKNANHTKEDTKTIRDILTKAIEEWDK